ncbi:MAG: hypothetical protein KDA97_13455 [Acidimicrobiales bacterium]|nr:hypothetical protein [Acidimicrobiales bacterium]
MDQMTSRRNALPAVDEPRLTARSVLASILLGVRPAELPTAALVRSATLLGVAPGTARVAISRMLAAGELEATDGGYRLAGHLRQRSTRQDLSVAGVDGAWDGTWAMASVPGEARAAGERAELRRAMAALRYAELRDGTWLRPANLPGGVLVEAEAIAARAVRVDGPLQGVEGPALAARLWDLGGWARTARQLIERLDPLQARLDAGDATALADGFVAAAAVLRHLQADPLLPSALVPPRWPGEELRAAQHRFDAAFKAVVRAEHRGDR